MLLTLLLSVILMAALFLLLFAGVAFIQKKSLFSSAPQDIQDAIKKHGERFPGMHILGWILAGISIAAFVGAFAWGCMDGVKNGYGFWDFFIRFLIMLLLLKAFDIIFFDWFLLTKTGFYQHYFPETEGLAGYNSFGFNRKEQIIQTIMMPFVALLLAWVGTVW